MKKRIFLDAGHGGRDCGAYNYDLKIAEADVALKVVKLLRKCFTSKKRKFKFSRKTDKKVDLNSRWKKASKWNADLSICVHCNSYYDKKIRGCEVYHYGNNDKLLAEILSKNISKELGINNRGAKEHAFAMTKYFSCPAVLIEIDYISNNDFAKKCKDEKYLQKIANVIYKSVREWEKA